MGRISYAALLILRCGGKEREAKKKEWEELNVERGCGLCKEQDKFFLNSIQGETRGPEKKGTFS